MRWTIVGFPKLWVSPTRCARSACGIEERKGSPSFIACFLYVVQAHLFGRCNRPKESEGTCFRNFDFDRLADEPRIAVKYRDMIGSRAAGELSWSRVLRSLAKLAQPFDKHLDAPADEKQMIL